jgi:hypothetical protein
MKYKSPEEMLAAIDEMQKAAKESSVPRLLRQFKPRIIHLQTFTFGVTLASGYTSIRTSCFWGLITLMLEVYHLVLTPNQFTSCSHTSRTARHTLR